MQRLVLGAVALGIALLVGIVSGRQLPAVNLTPEPSPLTVQVEDRNPWTNQPVNRSPGDFQFAIVTDRTGGRRPGIFTEAVRKLNLLQPEFVISVG
ncbi:MAG: hypothetical protein ACK50P_00890, partial [Planctomycetaceae bacterium]